MTQRVLIVGLGNMGLSHARAYHRLDGFEIAGLCSRSASTITDLDEDLATYPRFDEYETALKELKPDIVCICTWPDSHADFARKAFAAGAHVFLEKPLAETLEDARTVIAAATSANRKLVVGYILRQHPSWQKFIEIAQTLGKPLVMRMNLNQQSSGAMWTVHKNLMNSISPIVDCGVHYVDVMCQMTRAKPVSVHAIGVCLTEEIAPNMYNYGQLQVRFDDGSVGWYEAGWGPMMSETAFFVKDVIGPEGSVSIVAAEQSGQGHQSDDVNAHTKTDRLRIHHADLDHTGRFRHQDDLISMKEEPDHDALCAREQAYLLEAIEKDIDLTSHLEDALNSMAIVLAADQSVRTGEVVRL
ncbi:Gfo/Idh/MocA family protein [Aestuariispira insulae]|uniref:Putative dehydrogenase n=1 Tax=Aestuariispira insulae TaxID=1461337 RepID=A0A3D9HQ44_9PROT|nr:Gfo/Idh/MocA family oxidoreductase [Aestuariispira insulae]RED51590.1 putative dehydrogenase [Aestuariispira insulae]